MVSTPSSGWYVPDDPLDEGLTIVRVGTGYGRKAEKGQWHEDMRSLSTARSCKLSLDIWLKAL